MKLNTVISVLAASILVVASASVFAGQGQHSGQGADRGQQGDRHQAYDRDRMHDRARTGIPEQDRDRDRTNMQDPSKMKDQDIYGNQLMTANERKQYRKELGNAATQQSQMEFQARHEQQLQKRALEQGKDLVPPGQGPIYGGELMSVQERNQYREQLRLIGSEKEHQQLQVQHRDRINQRAAALGLEVEEVE
jgi:hypothetical protein